MPVKQACESPRAGHAATLASSMFFASRRIKRSIQRPGGGVYFIGKNLRKRARLLYSQVVEGLTTNVLRGVRHRQRHRCYDDTNCH